MTKLTRLYTLNIKFNAYKNKLMLLNTHLNFSEIATKVKNTCTQESINSASGDMRTYGHKNTCTTRFIVALLIIAKTQE